VPAANGRGRTRSTTPPTSRASKSGG
jgi:hypothetical protein